MIHDKPVSVFLRSVVKMPSEKEIGVIGLWLYCDEGAFAIEFHEQDVEVLRIRNIHALINPWL